MARAKSKIEQGELLANRLKMDGGRSRSEREDDECLL